jgi:bifunctional non-homologous end joining protein LigD
VRKWMDPTLCLLVPEPFDSPHWIFEPKYDGVRCLLFFDGRTVRLLSRNQNLLNQSYPEIALNAMKLSSKPFIADGEIVVDKGNHNSFSQRMGVQKPSAQLQRLAPCHLYLFDLLQFESEDLRSRPLSERRQLLRTHLRTNSRIHRTPAQKQTGKAFFRKMCREGYEGAVGKDATSPYTGRRDGSWKKFKCQQRQEFVITGYTEPKGSRQGFGALLVGYYKDGQLVQAGRVGTGFSDQLLRTLTQRLKRLKTRQQGEITYVKPQLICEVAFTEWTPSGSLRHPSFLGLRTDKRPRDVVRE